MAWLGYAATLFSSVSSISKGETANAQQQMQAKQDEADANASQVQAQAAAFNERRRAKIIRSRALAVAGASGAGVSDPTVVDILSGIDTEGEVRAMNALYEGDYEAAGLRSGAKVRRRMGKAAQSAGYLSAASSLAGGAGHYMQNNPRTSGMSGGAGVYSDSNPSFFQKYG